MRRLALLLLLSISAWAQMPMGGITATSGPTSVTFVQSCSSGSNAAACTFASNPVAGHTLIFCGGWGHPTLTGGTITGISTPNTTFSIDAGSLVRNDAVARYAEIGGECGHAFNITGGANDKTVTCTASLAGLAFAQCMGIEVTAATATDCIKTGTGTSDPEKTSVNCSPAATGTAILGYVLGDDNFGGGSQYSIAAVSGGTLFTNIFANVGGGAEDAAALYGNLATATSGQCAANRGATIAGYVFACVSVKP